MKDGTLQGLLDSIRAAPLDDAPRWVLADYFDSIGEAERARFVRLQLEWAQLEAWDPQALRNRIQQRALLQAHAEAWRAELPQFQGVVWGRFERGLVNRVAFDSVAALAAHGEACGRAAPFSSLFLRWPQLEERVELAPIEGLQELTIVGTLLKAEDMEWLANSPLLSTIRALNLIDTQMEAPALRHLLASPYLEQLSALRLPVHNFGNEGVELLVQASMPNLVELDISVASQDDLGSGGRYLPTVDATGAAALASWPGLARLRTLHLTGNQIGVDGLSSILSSPGAAGLKVLGLRGLADMAWDYEERPDVLLALASTTSGMALDELDISECPLSEESASALLESPALAELKVLHYNYTPDGPFRWVVQAPFCESLRILSANDCRQDSLTAILQRAMPQLHTLSVSSTYYWSRGKDMAGLLANAPAQPALLQLDLTNSGIEDGELDRLGTVTSLPSLLSLNLAAPRAARRRGGFSEEAAAHFAASPLGSRLESLDLGYPALNRAPEPAPLAVGQGEYRGPLRYL